MPGSYGNGRYHGLETERERFLVLLMAWIFTSITFLFFVALRLRFRKVPSDSSCTLLNFSTHRRFLLV